MSDQQQRSPGSGLGFAAGPPRAVPLGAGLARVAFAVLLTSVTADAATAADGAALFRMQCKICHSGASTPLAPSLAGVAGHAIAGRSDFNYSAALKAKHARWTDANLQAWLTSPPAFAPGSRMPVSVKSAEDRTAIIQYLKTLK